MPSVDIFCTLRLDSVSWEHWSEMAFPDDVKRLRRERGLTQRELADLLGVNREAVARWEAGMREPSRMARRFVEHLLECGKETGDA